MGIFDKMSGTRASYRVGISVFAMAAALSISAPAAAQSDTATLQGHVDGAAPGTVVVATDTHTGQRSSGTVNANGDYVILGLRPSTYSVSAPGREASSTTLFVGQTGVVDFLDRSSTIVVSGRVRREVRTQSISTNITPAQIENLPQNSRNFLSFAALAPGVSVTRGDNAQVQAGAVASSNTNVMLDGMSMKNPINHGGIFGQNFGLGNPFPQVAVQEYRVDTQNFGAESGQVGSALITAVTKTGGDSFHGSAFIEFQPNSFFEQPYFDRINHRPKPVYNRKQFGGELGGPIIPGKLTFYVAGEGTSTIRPTVTGNVNNLPSNLLSLINVSHDFNFHQGLYFGKLTFYATDNDTLNASAFVRRENNLADIDNNAASTHGRTILTHQDRYQFAWKHTAGDMLNTFQVAWDKATQSTPSVGTGPEYVLSAATDFSTLAQLGAHFFEQGDTTKTLTFKDDLTLRRTAHTIKLGAQVALVDMARTVNDHFNGSYFYANPGAAATFDPATAIPYGARINIAPSPTLAAKDTQIGLYIQDEWKPDTHWTINAGLRWDYESNANNNSYVTPTAIATALRAYPGWKARGINPEDYISTGSNRKPFYGAFQPRLGFSYDVYGDRDFVIFGGAGRYYDRSLFIEGVIETLTNSNKIPTVNFCSATVTTNCITWSNALRDPNALRSAVTSFVAGGGGSVFVLNNKTAMPYSDQFDLGIRKRLGGINTSITLSHIRSHNIFMYTRANYYTNGWYSRYLIRDGAGNVIGCTNGGDAWIQDNTPNSTYAACPAGGGQLAGFNGKLDIGSNNGRANYTAIYLTAEKPFTDTSRFGFQTSFTFQIAKSNVAQELNSDEFYNGSRVDAYGWNYVNGLEDWRWVTTANWRAPLNIILSGTLTLSSGPRFGHIDFANAPDGACCYANMGGPLQPGVEIGYKRLDLRIAKAFKMPFASSHEFTVDFQAFNVFNWLNRNYSSWGAGGGTPPSLQEDSQVGNDARSFQVGLKYKF